MKAWTIHAIFSCRECGWEEQDYTTAREKARKHHDKTGHYVVGEVGIHVEYGRPKGEQA